MTKTITPTGSHLGELFSGYSSRKQLADKIGRTETTIRKWEKLGLPVTKRGQLRLYNDELVRKWVLGELSTEPRSPGRPPKTKKPRPHTEIE